MRFFFVFLRVVPGKHTDDVEKVLFFSVFMLLSYLFAQPQYFGLIFYLVNRWVIFNDNLLNFAAGVANYFS